jgi:hypothetical protein
MAVKTVDRTFVKGQSVELFRAAIKSQATCDPYERRLIGGSNQRTISLWDVSRLR